MSDPKHINTGVPMQDEVSDIANNGGPAFPTPAGLQHNDGKDASTTSTVKTSQRCQRDKGNDASATTLAAPAQRSRLCCYVVIVSRFGFVFH